MQHPPSPELLKSLEQEMDDDLHPVLRWIVDHLKALGLAVAAIVAIVAGGTAFQHYQEIQLARAQEALAHLGHKPPSAQTVAELQALAQGHAGIRTPALLEALAHAEALGDAPLAASLWGQMAQGEDAFRPVAILGQIHALLRAERFAEALALAEKTTWPQPVRPLALSAQALAAEGTGQTAKALAAYRELKALVPQSPYLDAKIAHLEAKPQS